MKGLFSFSLLVTTLCLRGLFAESENLEYISTEEELFFPFNEEEVFLSAEDGPALPTPDETSVVSLKQNIPSVHKPKLQSQLEVKVGYFFFTNSKMRKVYDSGGWDLQLSGSFPVWKWLELYASVEYLEKHGRTLGLHQKTSLWEVPLSLGLKPVVKIADWAQYYAALGPRYIFVHVHNHSSSLDRTLDQNGVGGFVNTGFNFFPTRHFVVDIFGEYSYARMHFHASNKNLQGETAQVGGLLFGVGLGYVF